MSDRRFPNESDQYRAARDALLDAEIALRGQIEAVAAQRRALPPGGALLEDYAFDELVDGAPQKVKLSELFEDGQDTLLLYNFMYGPNAERPCPMCTSAIDGWDGQTDHLTQSVSFVVVGRSPIARIQEYAIGRGWTRLRFVSSADNSYNTDYFGERPDGGQMPMMNVFRKTADGIHHTWGSEMLYGGFIEGGEARHVDALWPLWSFLDMTPGGRGTDWYPKVEY